MGSEMCIRDSFYATSSSPPTPPPGATRYNLLHSKAHSNEYENNTHKAEQSLPAWLGAGGSNRSTRPLLSSSDGARTCRDRPRFLLLYSSKKQKNKNKNNQHQVSPFYSKLNICREGLVSEKGECSPKSGSGPHILGSSPHTKIK